MFVTFLCSKKVTRRKKSEQKLQLVLGVDLFCKYLATASRSCCFAVVRVCIYVGVLVLCQSCDMSYCGKC